MGGGSASDGTSTGRDIQGFVQKGPFVIGSTVLIQELDSQLVPTGRSITTFTTNDMGGFSFKTDYKIVEIFATGYFYNEDIGDLSSAPLQLTAIADISSSSEVYVNILTHLTSERLRYLLEKGSSFVQSLSQAKTEIFTIFNIDPTRVSSDLTELNIVNASDENAALLTVSAYMLVLAHGRAGSISQITSKLTEALNTFKNDIKEDGILANSLLANDIKSAAGKINPEIIANNLISRLNSLGQPTNIPDINLFLDTDWDGIPNSLDPDMDNDGVPNSQDAYPLDPTRHVKYSSELIAETSKTVRWGPQINDSGEVVWREIGATEEIVSNLRGVIFSGVVDGVSLNDSGEIVWSAKDSQGHSQIYSNVRGQITIGSDDNDFPAINDAGEIVWVKHIFDGTKWTSQIFSNIKGYVTNDDKNHYYPSLNDSNEIIWQEHDGVAWQIFSNLRGQLTFYSNNSLQGFGHFINDDGIYVWTEVDVSSGPPYRVTLWSSLNEQIYQNMNGGDIEDIFVGSINDAGVVAYTICRSTGICQIYKAVPSNLAY